MKRYDIVEKAANLGIRIRHVRSIMETNEPGIHLLENTNEALLEAIDRATKDELKWIFIYGGVNNEKRLN